MDEEEEGVLSFLRGREGCDEEYSSISEFKQHLKESDLMDERRWDGCVLWRANEQQLNNTTHLQHKITTLFKHLSSPWLDHYYYLGFSELGQLDDVPIKLRSVQYGQMEHQQAEEPLQYVSDGMQTKQCTTADSVFKKTETGKRKTGFHFSLEDLQPHFGKKLKDVAEQLGVGRSTIKRACRDHGIKRWPCTEKQTKNPCIYEKEKEQDSHQDEHPSTSGSLELLDTSLHQNGPCTNTESLIVLEHVEKGSPKKKAHKAVVKERKIRSFDLLPLPLKMLYSYAENELNDGSGIPVALDDEVFGDKCKIYVHLDDIIPFCDLEPISGNCIVVYIWQLYKKIKKENTLRRFHFVNPSTIPYVANSEPSIRAYKLADRLKVACPDQLVLVPCNIYRKTLDSYCH